MMTEIEIVARFERLEKSMLERWIAAGWLKPTVSQSGYLFDEMDVARTHFLCDLAFAMELGDEELAMVLSLVDRLHATRSVLRELLAAVERQPQEVRDAILADVRRL